MTQRHKREVKVSVRYGDLAIDCKLRYLYRISRIYIFEYIYIDIYVCMYVCIKILPTKLRDRTFLSSLHQYSLPFLLSRSSTRGRSVVVIVVNSSSSGSSDCRACLF